MDKKSVGFFLGAAAGFSLAWLFRARLAALVAPAQPRILIERGKDGRPKVTVTPEVIVVRKNNHVRWQAINDLDVDVEIALADWQDQNHHPVRPAVDADPADHEHPPQTGLTREVPAGKKRPIRGRARGPDGGNEEFVKYSVLVDGSLGVDPIVKLVL